MLEKGRTTSKESSTTMDGLPNMVRRKKSSTITFARLWEGVTRARLTSIGMPYTLIPQTWQHWVIPSPWRRSEMQLIKYLVMKPLAPMVSRGFFFKKCWDTIKGDVMKVIESFGDLHVHVFHWLNSATMALLPKKEGAKEVSNFRPISRIHAFAKLIAKMLALCLSPHMNGLVSNAQSAFIKNRKQRWQLLICEEPCH
jgi:hypothetical protein